VNELGTSHPTAERHGKPWGSGEDRRLYDAFVNGLEVDDLAREHKRKVGGIRSRLKRLGLIDANGCSVSPVPPFGLAPRAAPTQIKELNVRERIFIGLLRDVPRRKQRIAFAVLRALVDQATLSSTPDDDIDAVTD